MSRAFIAFVPPFAFRPVAAVDRVLAAALGVAEAAGREWRLRQELAALERLDARALHDLGLGAGELEDAVRHGRRRSVPGPARPPAAADDPRLPPSWTEWR